MDDYYNKYLKYKLKYNILLNQSNIQMNEDEYKESTELDKNILIGGDDKLVKFKCKTNAKQYANICTLDQNGNYVTKEECMDECENKYINVQLKKANLYKETVQFYYFMKDLIHQEKMKNYVIGGNAIGMAVLKLIYEKYSNDSNKFKQVFTKFLQMELIKDWDFSARTENKISSKYRKKLDKLANDYKLASRASTYILYQTRKPIQIYGKALFEISIFDTDFTDYSNMEIPATSISIDVDENNIKYVFIMAKNFYSWNTKKIFIDLDIVKKVLAGMKINVPPHSNGFFNINKSFDFGELNSDMINFIKKFSSGNSNHIQFLATHIIDPYRLIYRLHEKNLEKTLKIQKFIRENLKCIKNPYLL